jgi:hypothetical protein
MHLMCTLVDERLASEEPQGSLGVSVRTMWELPRRRRVAAGRESGK